MRPSQLEKLLDRCIPAGIPVLISGGPGGGKTEISKQSAIRAGRDVIIMHPVIKNPTSFEGLGAIVKDEKGTPHAEFLPYGDMVRILEATKPTVAIIDDMGQAPMATQAALMQVILERSINGQVVSPHVTFVACTNRRQDKSGVNPILRALLTRFATVVTLEPDVTDWSNWGHKEGVNPLLIAFINYRPDYLNRPPEHLLELQNYPNPRTLWRLHQLLTLAFEEEMELEVYSGAVGEAMTVEFLAFRNIYTQLPDPLLMLAKPHDVVIPKDLGTLYALLAALTDKVDKENVGAFFTIMQRLKGERKFEGGPELVITGVKGLITRKGWVQQTQAFIKWAVTDGQHLL
jgi:hypothetical protein